mgnify:CR=1 FL=1
MSNGEKRRGLWIDPRTKILLLLLCVLSATMAPSLLYEMLVVALVACFGTACGKIRYSIIGIIVYGVFYLLTQAVLQMPSGNVQVMLIAFLGLVHKVYPCGIFVRHYHFNDKSGGISLCHEPKPYFTEDCNSCCGHAALCTYNSGGLAFYQRRYADAGCIT